MSKKGKRPGRVERDVHAAIAEEAARLRIGEASRVSGSSEFPESTALLNAAREAISANVPRFLSYRGRRYWLRVRLLAQFDVFAGPGDAVPLLEGLAGSTEDYGHAPAH